MVAYPTDPTSIPASTGLYSGGVMTPNNATSFNLSAGVGWIIDYLTNPSTPVVTKVNIAAQTVTVPGSPTVRWWVADVNGNVTSLTAQPTADQRRTLVQLGTTAIVGGVVQNVVSAPAYTPQSNEQLYDFMYNTGSFVASGATFAANGANLLFNLIGGTIQSTAFNYAADPNNPSTVPITAAAPSPFFYATQLANSEVQAPGNLIDPTHWDNAGTLTLLGTNTTASIQRVYLFGTRNTATQVAIQYGQATYTSLANAKAALGLEPFTVNPDFVDGGILLGWIITTKQCTSLLDTTNALLVDAGRFAAP